MDLERKLVLFTAISVSFLKLFSGTGVLAVDIPNSIFEQVWEGKYGGVPPWHRVQPNEFVHAFERLIQQAETELDVIAENDEPPTFENTIVAMENAGRLLDQLRAIYGVHSGNLNVGPMPDVQKAVNPKLAAHQDRVTQNVNLFKRIEAIYESEDFKTLAADERRLVEDRFKSFVRRGAKLSASEKKRLSTINQRLASLYTDFMQNVLDDEQKYVTWIDSEGGLAGLPVSVVSAMANAAKERGTFEVGRYQYPLVNGSVSDLLG